MPRKSFFAIFLGLILLLGSIPSSSSEVEEFSDSVEIYTISKTNLSVINDIPEPKSEEERKKKFDLGFYDKIWHLKTDQGNKEICSSDLLKNYSGELVDSLDCVGLSQLDYKRDFYDVIILVPNGVELNIDFENDFLLVKEGSRVIIKEGGKIT